MKKILISLLLLTSCEDLSNIGDSMQENYLSDGRYYKDQRVGICYFMVGYGNTQSITCVPCDKLTNVITFSTK